MKKVYEVEMKESDGKRGKGDAINYLTLYRFSTLWEKCCVIISLLLSLVSALMTISAIIVYGELSGLFIDRTEMRDNSTPNHILTFFGASNKLVNASREDYYEEILRDSNAFAFAGLAIIAITFVSSSLSIYIINWAAAKQVSRMRYKFLQNLLRQDMTFYDLDSNLSFGSKITDDLEKIKEGISEKVAMVGYLMNNVIVSIAMAFFYGWYLALIGVSVIPISIAINAFISKIQSKCSERELEAYSHASRCVEEVLSGIRTVVAFGGERKEIDRYSDRLRPAEKCSKIKGLATAAGSALSWFITYSLNALIFYFGTKLIVAENALPLEHQTYTPGILVIILLSIFNAAQNIAMFSPHTEAFSAAKGAAKNIFPLIDKEPKIDSLSEKGLVLNEYSGDIVFNDVHFSYPSRSDVKVLRGLNMSIKKGESVALVGESGCGKSTILQLIQRLYDPDSGKISLHNCNLKDLNLHQFRTNIGVVGQEPVLFAGTIKDNIAIGKKDASGEDVINAAKLAHAHDFVMALKDGYDSVIGERGSSLSGGQKQRIAIARSMIRDPKILLLDEATSALDTTSEKEVEKALDVARVGRTTIMVSHRLSSIVNADRIIVLKEGIIAEDGSHDELMKNKGLYFDLLQSDISFKENDKQEMKDIDEKSTTEAQNEMPLSRKSSIRDSVEKKLRKVSQRLNSLSSQIGEIKYIENKSEEKTSTVKEEAISNWDLLKLNKPEWKLIMIGSFSSFLVGACLPTFAILFSQIYAMFGVDDNMKLLEMSQYYSGLFLLVSFICALATFLQVHVFNVAGLKLTTRLRIQTFGNFLKQEMAWFDEEENAVGALCARLSADAAAVQGATGTRVGTMLQSFSTVIIGLIVALWASWKLTLVSALSMPIVIGTIYLEGIVARVFKEKEREAMENASSIATEAIMNIKTVQSLGIEKEILDRYSEALERSNAATVDATRPRGAVYGLGCSAPTVGYTLGLFYGGYLISSGEIPYQTSVLVCDAIIYGSWMLGHALSFAPNFNSARSAGERIVQLIQRKSNMETNEHLQDKHFKASGAISYKDVTFSYPKRKNENVLNRINLEIEKGKTTALVGHSGCGKSTLLQLLQRFYDPKSGQLKMDGINIPTEMSLTTVRSQLGIVQQEPVLFDRTIAENIAYGDNSRVVTMEEINEAAKAANIHNFIVALPKGYDTSVGSRGAQISGGQKQRIAIARALVKNPTILLLDEATSALDASSEKLVQEALDGASTGRTCIVIAHRLQTIQRAHCICVIHKGEVVEKGTHDELLKLRGHYYQLSLMQGN